MPIYVYQTFVLKQEKFKEGIENLREIKKFRNDHYSHHVEILTPVSGEHDKYALLTTYDGLAEMELQSKKMFDDEDYLKLIGDFFLENIVQGSMYTQIYRSINEKNPDKKQAK
ncbi:hypothetical protein ACQYAD_08885 [Neobacillus sp. SM06]|uniref:hypothetical protein n=1 Tax=Neobacillus sp. SM06 TaxID=3422492 RepID=UPI003D2C22FB